MSPSSGWSTTRPHGSRPRTRRNVADRVTVRSVRCTCLVLLLAAAACTNDGAGATKHDKPVEATRKLAGVYPERFQCDSILTLEALGQLLGGDAHKQEGAMTPPRGIAAPCTYEVTVQGQAEYWTYDFDCRDGWKQRADALFEQYRTGSSDLVEHFNALADAGAIKPTDAGIPIKAPEAAVEVAVGAKGLDHHGQGVIFIDDDAPCYVRVIGPDQTRRLELAKMIAKNLTFANAPMTPRPMP